METVLSLLTAPAPAFQKIRLEVRPGRALRVLGLLWLGFLTAVGLAWNAAFDWGGFAVLFLAGWFALGAGLALECSALHFFAKLAGGAGRVGTLFSMLCHAAAPLALLLPAALILRGAGILLVLPLGSALLIWTAWLGVQAIQKNYHLTPARAFAVAAGPALTAFFLLAFAVSIAAGLLALRLLTFAVHLPRP